VEKEFARLFESVAVNGDASSNGWVTSSLAKDACRRFGMRFIEFV
jgi:hypothetical protein